MAESALERAERQYQQAKARLSAAKSRENAAERKRDTRRKVILGGALIDLAARDDRAMAMLDRLIDNLTRDQDKASFDDWERPRVEQPRIENSAGASQIAAERDCASGVRMHRPAPSNGSTGVSGGATAMQADSARRENLF